WLWGAIVSGLPKFEFGADIQERSSQAAYGYRLQLLSLRWHDRALVAELCMERIAESPGASPAARPWFNLRCLFFDRQGNQLPGSLDWTRFHDRGFLDGRSGKECHKLRFVPPDEAAQLRLKYGLWITQPVQVPSRPIGVRLRDVF